MQDVIRVHHSLCKIWKFLPEYCPVFYWVTCFGHLIWFKMCCNPFLGYPDHWVPEVVFFVKFVSCCFSIPTHYCTHRSSLRRSMHIWTELGWGMHCIWWGQLSTVVPRVLRRLGICCLWLLCSPPSLPWSGHYVSEWFGNWACSKLSLVSPNGNLPLMVSKRPHPVCLRKCSVVHHPVWMADHTQDTLM